MAEGVLSKEALLEIMTQAKKVLAREPNLIKVDGRVVMIGDIHGQFFDICDVLRR